MTARLDEAQRDRIRRLLRLNARSQAWLARQIGMNESLLSHYLAGRRPSPADLTGRIAEVLGVSAAELAEGKAA